MLLPALAAAKKKKSAAEFNASTILNNAALAFRIWEGDNGDQYPMDVPAARGGTKEFDTGADTFPPFSSPVE